MLMICPNVIAAIAEPHTQSTYKSMQIRMDEYVFVRSETSSELKKEYDAQSRDVCMNI